MVDQVWPIRGSTPWDDNLRAYIDGGDTNAGFDPGKDRALRRFRAALGQRETAPVKAAILTSDSWWDRYGATTLSKAADQRLMRYIRSGLGLPAGGIGGVGAVNMAPGMTGHPVGNYGATGGFADTTSGLGMEQVVIFAGGSIPVTVPNCTGFDLIMQGNEATFTTFYAVDGGEPVGAWTYRTNPGEPVVIPVRGLARGNHSVVLTTDSVAALTMVVGYDGDETSGFHLYEGALASTSAKQFRDNAMWDIFLEPIDPALVLIGQGTNDWDDGRTPVQFQADLTAIIARIKAACTTAPSIVITSYPQVAAAPTVGSGDWDDFKAAQAAIAQADADVAFLDLGPLFGHWDGTNRGGMMTADLAHPSDGGYDAVARYVADYLLG